MKKFFGAAAVLALVGSLFSVQAEPSRMMIPAAVSTSNVFAAQIPTAPTTAQPDFVAPKLTLQGTGKYDPDEYVVVSVATLSQPRYLISNSYEWRVWEVNRQTLAERDVRVNVQEDKFTLHSPIAGKVYQVECIVVSLYAVRDTDKKISELATRTTRLRGSIEINGSAPAPGPAPTPTPPQPAPTPLTDGRFKLAKTTYDIATAKAPTERRQEICTALATSFRSVRARIDNKQANSLIRAEDILRAITQSNDEALARLTPPAQRAPWRPFSVDLETAVFNIYSNRQLNTLTDWSDALEEIAAGLAAVR